jgi:RimJ/RimL family protein N-acetyltransferase
VPGPALRSERLLLRRWRAEDIEPFAAINADPEVMEHFPAPLSRAESEALIARIEQSFETRGYGLWAVEGAAGPDRGRLAGFTGLNAVPAAMPFAPAVEVGWRLGREFWGRGFASEAATAALAFGFGTLGLDSIVSFTAKANERSQRVMLRIGMRPAQGLEFDHPGLPGSPLERHVLYRIERDDRPGTDGGRC